MKYTESISADFTEKKFCGINQPPLVLSFKNIYCLRVPAPILPREHRLFIVVNDRDKCACVAAFDQYFTSAMAEKMNCAGHEATTNLHYKEGFSLNGYGKKSSKVKLRHRIFCKENRICDAMIFSA